MRLEFCCVCLLACVLFSVRARVLCVCGNYIYSYDGGTAIFQRVQHLLLRFFFFFFMFDSLESYSFAFAGDMFITCNRQFRLSLKRQKEKKRRTSEREGGMQIEIQLYNHHQHQFKHSNWMGVITQMRSSSCCSK